MDKPSKSAPELKRLIESAIRDLEVTPEEYDAIMAQADADGHRDPEEVALLTQFHELINNGTIKRVRG